MSVGFRGAPGIRCPPECAFLTPAGPPMTGLPARATLCAFTLAPCALAIHRKHGAILCVVLECLRPINIVQTYRPECSIALRVAQPIAIHMQTGGDIARAVPKNQHVLLNARCGSGSVRRRGGFDAWGHLQILRRRCLDLRSKIPDWHRVVPAQIFW